MTGPVDRLSRRPIRGGAAAVAVSAVVASGGRRPAKRTEAVARRLNKRAFRAADRQFLAEGPQAAREALSRLGTVVELRLTDAAARRHPELVRLAAADDVKVAYVAESDLAALADTVTPQGVVAICRFVDISIDAALQRKPSLLTLLASVRDPGNAGTVIRSADAAGSGAVVLAGSSVDPYNPKVVRATAGSLFHLDVVRGLSPADAVGACRAAGYQVLAADGAGELDLPGAELAGLLGAPTAWLFGNEAWGLPAELAALADHRVAVPILGAAESLNLAAAAAVCLFTTAFAQTRAGSHRLGAPSAAQ